MQDAYANNLAMMNHTYQRFVCEQIVFAKVHFERNDIVGGIELHARHPFALGQNDNNEVAMLVTGT